MRFTSFLCGMLLFLAQSTRIHGEEVSIENIRMRLEGQSARLFDLQRKHAQKPGAAALRAKRATTLRKSASVTVGGMLETRYFYHAGTLESALVPVTRGRVVQGYQPGYRASGRRDRADYKMGDFKIAEARLRFNIEVDKHIDAYLQIDLASSETRRKDVCGIAHNYWLRWKNIRDSGFGVLVGRNNFAWGDREMDGIASGYLGAAFYMNTLDGGVLGLGKASVGLAPDGRNYNQGEGMFVGWATLLPHHTGWYHFRTTQINPFWEGYGGRLRLDLSLFQSLDRLTGESRTVGPRTDGDGTRQYRSINCGLGTGSARLIWKPLEDVQVTLSAVNFRQGNAHDGYSNGFDGRWGPWNLGSADRVASNNAAVNTSLILRPVFFRRLKAWGKWTRGWNEGWVRDMGSDVVNCGAALELKKGLTLFAQADYLKVDNDHRDVLVWHKARARAFYSGLAYKLAYGANVELGWRREKVAYRDRAGYTHTKVRLDTLYAHVGFLF